MDLGLVIIGFQLLGSVLGGFVLRWLYPQFLDAPLHLATLSINPTITPLQGAFVEFLVALNGR